MAASRRRRVSIRSFRTVLSLLVSGLLGITLIPTPSATAAAPVPIDTSAATAISAADVVTVAGSLQDELGCGGDWQPACTASELAYDAESQVYQATFALPAGSFEYKVTVGGSWSENYGKNAAKDGANILLSLASPTQVTFRYDPRTHWVTDSVTSVLATAIGDWQTEVGCVADDTPACLRTWLQDPDGDGTYTFVTTAIPIGAHRLQVARALQPEVQFPVQPKAFAVGAPGDRVTISYRPAADNAVDVQVEHLATGLRPGDEKLVRPSLRAGLAGEKFYFVMPDRFANGSTSNDRGGLAGTRLQTGFDPTDKGFYHGGDLAGLAGKLDYIKGLGTTAIWMTPMFKNRPVQGSGDDVSAGYHGYWITDFTTIDPHFGSNAEMAAFVRAAHAKGIKVFFDIITNHTADVIDYAEGSHQYRSKAAFPYIDVFGNEFDDRDYLGKRFPPMTGGSFPYTPVVPKADRHLKKPAWLNDVTMYHNRGDSTYSGENSTYGDFSGLDDLFTERPEVVAGMTKIFESWVDQLGIDGYRIDTVKHVNLEFWQRFAPAIQAYAARHGKPDFFAFGEVYESDPAATSVYTTKGRLQAVLDFPFQSAATRYVLGGPAPDLAGTFAKDDEYTDADSNAYALPTFLGNHDMGRIGMFLRNGAPGASDDELVARDRLAHALMYLSRGNPVVYYGDEQGFTGDGGDKDARQDMFASQVASYNDDHDLGTTATPARDNFDPTHPLYRSIADLAALTAGHEALRGGAQIPRVATGPVLAFSRIDRTEQVEYVVAFNSDRTDRTVSVPTYSASTGFTRLYGTGDAHPATSATRQLGLTVPALSAVVYRADAPLAPAAAPGVRITTPAANSEVTGKVELAADVTSGTFTEVSFAVRPQGQADWTLVGTDDNAPFRVFYDTKGLPKGSTLEVKAVVRDASGQLNGDTTSVYIGDIPVPPKPGAQAPRDYLVVHYNRPDGDYTGWGLHVWGDVAQGTDWGSPLPFSGEDEYGRFAWVKLAADAGSSGTVGFIVHNGDSKDPDGDRSVNPKTTGEIWLRSGDATVYPSLAAARGFARIHYHRPDGDYSGWGLHVWGDGLSPDVQVSWDAPLQPAGTDDFGVYFDVKLADPARQVGFIIHQGDTKDPGPDQFLTPSTDGEVFRVAGDEKIYPTASAARGEAVIHYHRDDGDYSGWTLYYWTGGADPVEWGSSPAPTGIDGFGAYWRVKLVPGAPLLNYIVHKGDTKDPGGDQSLDLVNVGHEAWFLSGVKDAAGKVTYLLPVLGGPGVDADLTKAKAQWIDRDTVVWKVQPSTSHAYQLRYDRDGAITATPDGVTGGKVIRLDYDPDGLTDAQKAAWPHLAAYPAFKVRAADAGRVREALRGQVVAVDRDGEGALRAATGVQLAGVLDDIYGRAAKAVRLGPVLEHGAVTLRLWAPTAQSVRLSLYRGGSGDRLVSVPMRHDEHTGVWWVRGPHTWVGRYYLYDVRVFAPSVGKVVTNSVTDPYSLALATNSTRSQIVDLDSRALEPRGWDWLRKPALAQPEDSSIYELHVRDFSINDNTVPAAERGTYLAFTHPGSDGMKHLRALARAGLNTVHLLPVFDIATIEERRSAQAVPDCDLASFPPDSDKQQGCVRAVAGQDGFNWGYDPWHYTTPEGSYAVDPEGAARTLQFRQMVQGLNNAGLRVVMDVVYNHTTASGQDAKSVLDRVVPGYYQRLDDAGAVATSTCCSNTATEHMMMGKLMVDSVVTWAKEYKVDGFRFDLMGHHSKQNMLDVRAALDALTPKKDGVDGSKIYVYGEGWNFGEVADNARFVQATQANLAGTGIGSFSDRLRDAVRGGGPFDADPRIQGFASGLFTDPNVSPANGSTGQQKDRLLTYMDQIKLGLAGNLKDYTFVDRTGATVKGSQVDYNGQPAGYAADPSETVTYVDAHDNETLYDALAYKLPVGTPMDERVRMNTMALSTVALGQGVAFWHAGTDVLRSKSLDRNSFDSGDWFNRLDWTYQTNNFGVGLPPEDDNGDKWQYAKPLLGNPALRPDHAAIVSSAEAARVLLAIRKSTPLFHLGTAAAIQQKVSFPIGGPSQTPGVITMRIDDTVGADVDRQLRGLVVVFNATPRSQTQVVAGLKGAAMALHPLLAASSDTRVKTSTFDAATGTLVVPARTVAVFVQR